MKTLKLRSLIIAGVVIAVSYSGFLYAGDKPAGKKVSLTEERSAVNKDLYQINQQQAEIKSLKKELKTERDKGLNTSATRNDLMKAKADLWRDRMYLAADKQALKKEHCDHVAAHKKDVKDARVELRKEQSKLNADLNAGKASAVARTEAVIDARQELIQAEKKLDGAKKERNSDLALINKEFFDVNGSSAQVLTVTDKTASAQARK